MLDRLSYRRPGEVVAGPTSAETRYMATSTNNALADRTSSSSTQGCRPRLQRWAFRAGVGIVVLIAGLWDVYEWFVALQNRNVTSGIAIGQHAPDLSLPDQSGRARSLHDLSGPKGLLLVFVRSADW